LPASPGNYCLSDYTGVWIGKNRKANDYAMGGDLTDLVPSKRTGAESKTKRGSSRVMACAGVVTGLLGAERAARLWQNRHCAMPSGAAEKACVKTCAVMTNKANVIKPSANLASCLFIIILIKSNCP